MGQEWQSKPRVQYNAVMLLRILSDNPGPTFTRNCDKGFVTTVKAVLRGCKDQSTQQILRETLDHLEATKQFDVGLQELLQMWRKEKRRSASLSHGDNSTVSSPPSNYRPSGSSSTRRDGGSRTLPNAVELASRVEEAKNTAKILLQLVQSTPVGEVLRSELTKEFDERCHSAQRSMQDYINAENPTPDHDTMQTLIETNEQLSLAISRYQRAVLAARRAVGASPSPQPNEGPSSNHSYGAFAPPSASPPPQQLSTGYMPPPNGNSSSYSYGTNYSYQQQQSYGGYQSLPEPPPGAAITLDHRRELSNNPFADPASSNQQILAIEPTNYGAFQASPALQHSQPQQPAHTFQPTQTFKIEPEPIFAATPEHRGPERYDNGSTNEQPQMSPLQSRDDGPSDGGVVTPQTPRRPGLGAWHQSEVTPSYMGRQASAANGLTMHGAGSVDENARLGAGPKPGFI